MMTISGKARLAGVMGWPVSHSRSPRLHNFWLAEHGIDGAYVPLTVRPENLEAALRALPMLGFCGCNVTLPHKEAAARLVDRLEDFAARVGAVNTVIVHPDGSLEGRNTDGFGCIENLLQNAPLWRPAAGPALVLGAGGAARAIVAALLDAGVPEVRLANRTRRRAEQLAETLGGAIRVIDWAEAEIRLADAMLLINTTTLGMQGQPALDLDLGRLPLAAVVSDAVYVPLKTALLAKAEARGNRIVDGIGMLLHQARPGFEAWFGAKPQVGAALKAHVLS